MYLYRYKVHDGHNKLTDRMITLGYPKACDDGVCFGVAKMGVQAILCGDTDTFDKRFYALSRIPKNQFARFIERIKAKRKRKSTPPLISEIPVFFDGIALYQLGEFKLNTQDLKQSLLMPIKLDKNGLNKIDQFHGAYTQSELVIYLNELENVLSKTKEPTAFLLNSIDHSIALGFDPRHQEWLLIDSNALPTQHFKNKEELAKKMIYSFLDNQATTFTTNVYSTCSESRTVSKAIKKCKQQKDWQEIHKVTDKNAQLKTSDNVSWLFVAIDNNDLQTVKKLLKKNNRYINDANKYDGKTPLYIAVFNGNLELVEELLKAGADPNLACKDGRTPLSVAAQKDKIDIIEKLFNANADLSLTLNTAKQLPADKVNLLKNIQMHMPPKHQNDSNLKKRKLEEVDVISNNKKFKSTPFSEHLSLFTNIPSDNKAQTEPLTKKRKCKS